MNNSEYTNIGNDIIELFDSLGFTSDRQTSNYDITNEIAKILKNRHKCQPCDVDIEEFQIKETGDVIFDGSRYIEGNQLSETMNDFLKDMTKKEEPLPFKYEHPQIGLQILELAELAKRPHYYCDDDNWYSCPQAVGGCSDERQGKECNCGSNEHNKKVLKFVSVNFGLGVPSMDTCTIDESFVGLFDND